MKPAEQVRRATAAAARLGVHPHVAEEAARALVGVAVFWESGDPPLTETARAVWAWRAANPQAGCGRHWYPHVPRDPRKWDVLAVAMVAALEESC